MSPSNASTTRVSSSTAKKPPVIQALTRTFRIAAALTNTTSTAAVACGGRLGRTAAR
jgi:hypothetical protein